MKEDGRNTRIATRSATDPEQARVLIPLLRERLDGARLAGQTVLKVGPEDLMRMCDEAGIEGSPVRALHALVRSNEVRLRGRWREGYSGERAPVYVARLTGRAT